MAKGIELGLLTGREGDNNSKAGEFWQELGLKRPKF